MFAYGRCIERKIRNIEEDIMEISLDWISSDITFLQSDQDYIKIIQRTDPKTSESELFNYEVKAGKLTIVDGRKKKLKLRIGAPKIYLEIYLPNKVFKSVSIKVVGGHLKLKNINTLYCNLDISSANATLMGKMEELDAKIVGCIVTGEHLDIQKMKVNSTSSKVQLAGTFSEIVNHTTGRSITLHSTMMVKSVKSTSTGANVKVGIPDNEGFTLKIKKTASNLQSDFSLEANCESLTYKNGINQLNAQVTGGRFTIYKV